MVKSQEDSQIMGFLKAEEKRQKNQLQMIPSENYASKAVRRAVGSVLMNKYSEGQPFKRYYQGNQNIDQIEALAKERALGLFNLDPNEWSVNVQPATGSIANLAVYLGLLELGDKIMGMYLYDGGHLSHGWRLPNGKVVSMTSKLFSPVFYQVEPNTGLFDYKKVESIALKEHPRLLISGGTAYPREIDHKKMSQIAKKCGALYMADIAHEAGLVAAGVNQSPFLYADVVTMTTRKTLRGPIGAMIFCKKELADKIDRVVFPGLQGGPLNHSIAGIAVALHEANQNSFKKYASQVIKNCQTLATGLMGLGLKVLTDGTDKHLLLIDLRANGVDGWYAALALEKAGIITNRSTIPYDTGSPYYPSGLRLGTPAITTRGMKEKEMKKIAGWILEIINICSGICQKGIERKDFAAELKKYKRIREIEKEVKALCQRFPLD